MSACATMENPERIRQQLEDFRLTKVPDDRFFKRRFGLTFRQVVVRHGEDTNADTLECIQNAERNVARMNAVSERKRNSLLLELARMGSLPSRIARRLAALVVLVIVAPAEFVSTVSETLLGRAADDEEQPPPVRPLSLTPNAKPNAPNR